MRDRQLVADLVSDIALPKMFKVKQVFPRPRIEPEEIPDIIRKLLSQKKFADKVQPGMRIAITAGSRGIANVALTTKCIADFVKYRGARPFIVPAMGSHGGATAEGQKAVLESYGITEEAMGCPILSSMEVKKIGVNEEGMDVFIDKYAAEADGIILGCRIKPHTAFRGPYESGIMKMMAIGLGKQHGAEVCHEAGFKNMAKYVPMFGRAIIKNAPILFAVPTIENAFDETCKIVAVSAEEIAEKEPPLLQEAFDNMPRILVDECDVLVVDQIGKNFSGDGMDPNITGTFCTPYATGGIKAQRVCVLDLSPETHGNGIGLGYSSATTKRAFEKLDLASMYPNAITCTVLGGVRIPIIMESDREAIQVCVRTCNEIDKKHARIVRIPNSLHIEHIMLSEAYYEEAKKNPDLIIESEPEYLPFDPDGNLW
ncbi:lactate racemase domain-containing protein [Lactonifactor longoviformis]|uniref:lactate racemase domain-containing protein n=1 Tax=Lactonifactor longoviformis TaxID=341220 RepID=UPI002109F813|nr:lactate racemase domain-containing protein [Lactonifactor longoviformis]MCQ4670461.1 lactate racemase domain-containing protein [Lactonifactor longoviformis]